MANQRTTRASFKAEEDNKQRPHIVEENRSLLLKHYCDYHSNDTNNISKESLVKQSREFLTSVKPEDRFVNLNLGAYRNLLKQNAENLEKESNQESISRITRGVKSLEQYGVNLWRFPWRKEYHTIKLYTAFFKWNIEQQLQGTEAIFDILGSLGYTVRGQQEVSTKEPNRGRAILISMELFLVQVDLQLIKEIIDRLPESELTLKDIVKARFETRDVDDATFRLERKAAKRRKCEEPRGDDVSSHRHTIRTHAEPIDKFNSVHSDSTPSDADTSADQTAMRKANRAMWKGRDDVAADTDDSSSGSTFSNRKPSGGAPAEYRVASRNTGGHYHNSINSPQYTDQDLYGVSTEGSQTNSVTQHNVNVRYGTFPEAARYSTVSQAGAPNALNRRYRTASQAGPLYHSDDTKRSQHYHGVPYSGRPYYRDSTKDRIDSAMTTSRSVSHPTPQYSSASYAGSLRDDTKGHAEVAESYTVLQTNKVISDTNEYHSKISSRTENGSARYANVQDIGSCSDQKLGSSESDKRMLTKETVRRHDAKYGPTGTSSSEPINLEKTEYSRDGRNDATSLDNGITEGVYAIPTAQSGVTDLNTTLKNRLSLEPGVFQAGKETLQQISKVSSEHSRQHDGESVASAQEATGSRGETTGGAKPARLLFQNESFTSQTAEKSEVEGSSPVPSWRTSAQRDRAQNAAHTSKSDRDAEVSHKGKAPHADVIRDDNSKCEQCSMKGTIICMNCRRIVCRKCREIYVSDHCEATKGDHVFHDLDDNKQKYTKSVDSSDSSTQSHSNTNEGSVNEENDWSCNRCTYLNPSTYAICAMCATTRGVGPVELVQAGSRVCRSCTFCNEENATVCSACHKTLNLHPSETSV